MKNMILILIFMIIILNCFAQSFDYEKYSFGDLIIDMCQDGNQYWIATFKGLYKWNFADSSYIFFDKNDTGINGTDINVITKDIYGNLWLGTAQNGLIKYDGTNWTTYYHDNSPITAISISTLLADNQGGIWIGAWAQGLIHFYNDEWTVYTPENSQLPGLYFDKLNFDNENNLWISMIYSSGGLVKFDGTTWTVYNSQNTGLPAHFFEFIGGVAFENDHIWVGGNEGVAEYNGESWILYSENEMGAYPQLVGDILIDSAGNKWICADRGLFKYDNQNWTQYLLSPSGVNLWCVNNIHFDENGHIRCINSESFENILTVIDDTLYAQTIADLQPLSGYISDIKSDTKNNKWIVFYKGGVLKLSDNVKTYYTNLNTGVPLNDVSYALVENSSKIWFTTTNSGIIKYENSTWTSYNSSNSGISDDGIINISLDANNCLWILTNSPKLVKFSGENWTVYDLENSNLPDLEYYSITCGANGVVWIGARGKFIKFTGSDFETYTFANFGMYEYSDYAIASLYEDTNNDLWLTSYKIFKFSNGTLMEYVPTTPDPLFENFYFIHPDNEGNLYFVDSQGNIVKYDYCNWSSIGFSNEIFGTPGFGSWVLALDQNNHFWTTNSIWDLLDIYNFTFLGNSPCLPEPDEICLTNYPNPFNPVTNISFNLPSATQTDLSIYNIKGQLIKTLQHGVLPQGTHNITWDGKNADKQPCASGVYFYKLKTGNKTITRKMLLLK